MMADEDTNDTQTLDPQVEQEARGLGWVPEDDFRGDKTKWVDAETFVKRGKEQLPILLENNRRLKGEVARLNGKVGQLEQLFEGSQEAILELKNFHEETFNARVKAEKERLQEQIVAARENDDVRGELEARDKLDSLKDEVRDLTTKPKPKGEAPPKKKDPPQGEADTPEFQAWRAANPWFLTDQRKAAMTFGLAQQLRAENPEVIGKDFFDLLDKAIEETMPTRKPTPGKVDPPRNGGGSGGGGKGYASLPADAKEVCDRQAKSFVGANKAFKTAKEWQDHYAKVYYDKDV